MSRIDDFFEYLGIVLLIINFCLYVSSYRTKNGFVAINYFTIYLTAICIIQIIAFVHAARVENNLYLSHFYFIVQFICLSLFFKCFFTKIQKTIVNYVLIIVLTILFAQYYTNPELYYQFNNLEIFITSVPLIIYSVIHMYNSLNKSSRYMYITAGILIYITTSTLIFILGNYLATLENIVVTNIWFINKVLYVVYMLLILIEWKVSFRLVKSKL
jgi:hypothetical protein